ncbi:MAG: CDP-diacylglycerol---glycerol-3-phosphate 3-phosphatidyltransferase [Pseudonocardiales bacterium]|nr:CDP-diacylglycerol---glycerol-3-phosphate 3-phosphatidyltransferase [Pseudonocardiales bacterium]
MPDEDRRVSNFNVANALTALRIVLVPVFGWLLLMDAGTDARLRWAAFTVFVVAVVTDRVDGMLARKHDLVTDFGKLMDPIADKALTGMAFLGLSLIGELWWWVTILVLGREWLVTLLRLLIVRYGVLAASRGGKLKTALQAIALSGFILPLHQFPDGWSPVGDVLWWAAVVVMAAAVVVTLVTGVDYARAAYTVRRDGRAAAAPVP